jgi:L-aminopeptidase/D-esterase-like protein
LDSCSGVTEYLREKGLGYKAGKYRVPIVCGAVLYDLEYKEFAYPDKQTGYLAAKNAVSLKRYLVGGDLNGALKGCVGAGTGATVGKILGAVSASKSGLGIHTVKIGVIEITAVVAVNAVGDVYGKNGEIIAGAKVGGKFADAVKILTEGAFGSGGDLKEKNEAAISSECPSETVKNKTIISTEYPSEAVTNAPTISP